jgi:hypothetical protein
VRVLNCNRTEEPDVIQVIGYAPTKQGASAFEGLEHQAVLATCGEFGLKLRKIGPAFVDDHHFPVDYRAAWNVEFVGND